MRDNLKLNKRQRAFVDEYCRDLNATRAYMRVYDCDYNSARASAAKLLAKNNIQAAIDAQFEENKKKIDKMRWTLFERINLQAQFDLTEIGNVQNNVALIKDFDELTPQQRLMIKKIKNTKDGLEVEFIDPQKSQELLNKMLNEKEDREATFDRLDTSCLNGLTKEDLISIINNMQEEEADDEE